METINNKTANNHKEVLFSSFKKSDSILIVSPFLSKHFTFFPFSKLSHLKEIILITTFKPRNDDLKGKINFFKEMILFCEKSNIRYNILIDNSLHGKLYICKKEEIYFEAIITSANFTLNGLKINNEWGVSVFDSSEIEQIVHLLLENIVFESITKQRIGIFEQEIAPHIKKKDKNNSEIDLSNFIIIKTNLLHLIISVIIG